MTDFLTVACQPSVSKDESLPPYTLCSSSPNHSYTRLPTTKRTAVLSPCGRYRYSLTRTWDSDPSEQEKENGHSRRLVFVLLNPSTADGRTDDPTVRRCTAFARDWGYEGVVLVNLFAIRGADPRAVFAHRRMVVNGKKGPSLAPRAVDRDRRGESASGKCTAEPIKEDGGKYQPDEDAEYEDVIELIGPNNEDHILSAVRRHRDVIAAWGRGAAVPRRWLARTATLMRRLCESSGARVYHLGLNQDGSPKHPLYLPRDTKPVLWLHG